MNVYAQQPPDKKEGDEGHYNVANPLACGSRSRLFSHGWILAAAPPRIRPILFFHLESSCSFRFCIDVAHLFRNIPRHEADHVQHGLWRFQAVE